MPKIRLDEDLQRLENPNVAATIQASRDARAGNAALQQARGGDTSDTALRGRAMAAVRQIERNAERGRRMASIQANRPGIFAPYQDTGRVSPEAVSRRSAFAAWVRNGRPQAALQTSKDSGGGIFVPIEISQTIRENLVLVDQIRRVASAVTTSTDTLLIPKRSAATTAQWLAENDTALPTDPTFGAVEISVNGARAYVDISNDTLADSAIDIEAWITRDLTKELARLEGVAFVNGTGIKQPQGLLQSADIASVATGDANLVTADSIVGLPFQLPAEYAAGPGACWLMNRRTAAAVRKLKDTVNRYLFDENLNKQGLPTIQGIPVVDAPTMPDVAAGATPIVFGDMQAGYMIVDRLNMVLLRDPYSQAALNRTRFYIMKRVGGAVALGEALIKLKVAAS